MSSQWAKNLFLVKQLDDDQMQVIPYPRTELHIHVMYKTVEAGVILGAIIGPAISLIRKRPMGTTVFNSVRNGAIIGAVAGPLMTELAIKNSSQERIYDRSYRLRYNRDQVRVDRGVTYGAAVGAATAAFMGQGVLPGLLIGIGASCVLGGVYNAKFNKQPKQKAPHALKKEEPKKEESSDAETPVVETKTE